MTNIICRIIRFIDVRYIDPLYGNSKQIAGLDGIRAIAFSLIFLFHVWYIRKKEIVFTIIDGVNIDLTHLFSQGYMGVPMFFILSGFLLAVPFLKALEEGKTFPSVYTYLKKRFLRIVPAYYTAIFVLMLFSPIVPCNGCAKKVLPQLLTHLSFTHTFTEYTMTGIAGPMWAVGVEVHFYIVLPGLMWLFFKIGGGRRMILSGLLVIAGISGYLTLHVPGLIENMGNVFRLNELIVKADGKVPIWNIFHLFSIFLIGVVMAYLYILMACRKSIYITIIGKVGLLSSACIILIYFVSADVIKWMRTVRIIQSSYGWPFVPFIFGVFILCISLQRGFINRVLEWPPFKVIGLVSYGMYLYHMTVLHALYRYFPDMRGNIINWGLYSFILTFILAILSFRYIEIPLLRKKIS